MPADLPPAGSAYEPTEPRALRALAHPTRLQLLGLLRREGALTASQAGERIGESPASCSFHLRQLARYGFVEEAGGGRGRERPWRARTMFTRLPQRTATPEMASAADALYTTVAERYAEQLVEWIERRESEPDDWLAATLFGDQMLYLTVEELAGLTDDVKALLERYQSRTANPDERPAGSRQVNTILLGLPAPPEDAPA